MNKVILALLTILMVSSAQATMSYWTGQTGTSDWLTSDNWYPGSVPSVDSHVEIGKWHTAWPVLDSEVQVQHLTPSWYEHDSMLTVAEGGSIEVSNLFNMSNSAASSIVNIDGGNIIAAITVLATPAGSDAQVNINSGYLETNSLTFRSGTANIDIGSEGTLYIADDKTSDVSQWISKGKITALNGSGQVDYDFGTTRADFTSVYVPEPATIALFGMFGLFVTRRGKKR